MDDYLDTADTVECAKELIKGVKNVLNTGGMNLRKISSNEPAVIEEIAAEDRLERFSENKSVSISVTILGSGDMTRRKMLKCLASVYDCLGMVLPYVVMLRLIFSKVWPLQTGWDEAVSEVIASEFCEAFKEINLLKEMKFPRWLGMVTGNVVDLIGFSDASKKAVAAVVYIRTKWGNEFKCHLVRAQAHTTPIATQEKFNQGNVTMPRLELFALSMLADLIENVRKLIEKKCKIKHTFLFCDSQVAVAWLTNCPTQKVISRLVKNVLKKVQADEVKYVRSSINIADVASRGCGMKDLLENYDWLNGPEFIRKNEIPPDMTMNDESKNECENPIEATVLLSNVGEKEHGREIAQLVERMRSFTIIMNAVMAMYRFIFRDDHGRYKWYEYVFAEMQLIKWVQNRVYANEIERLKKGELVSKRSCLFVLNPFLDDLGVMRKGGRVSNDDTLTYQEKYPIILPPNQRLVKLMVRKAHLEVAHAPLALLLRHVRSRFWIIKAKKVAKIVIGECVKCTILAKSAVQTSIGQLPVDRLRPVKPFTVTGVDMCGPFPLRANRLSASKVLKGWVALFICFFTRAVHVELCTEMTAECFYAAFRRFCSRRGTPLKVYSDNGLNFVGCSKMLKSQWKATKEGFIGKLQNIEWMFNPPASPEMGGIWERSIGLFKQALKRSMLPITPTYEEFLTLITRCEAMLNSKPLTEMAEDSELPVPLTPAHFLIHRPLIPPPDRNYDEHVPPSKRWQIINFLEHQLWSTWKDTILDNIQKSYLFRKKAPNLKVCDVVVLKKEQTAPTSWPLGRIVGVYHGIDDVVRVVDVKTANGTYKRKVNNVVPLGVRNDENESERVRSNVTVTPLNLLKSNENQKSAKKSRKNRNEGESSSHVARRSQRLATKHAVMICCLVMCVSGFGVINANPTIEALENTVYKYESKRAYEKVGEHEMKVITRVNVTHDLMMIEDGFLRIKERCKQEKTDECERNVSELKREMDVVKNVVSEGSVKTSRKKRAWGKIIATVSMWAASIGFAVYQQIEMNELQGQNKELLKQIHGIKISSYQNTVMMGILSNQMGEDEERLQAVLTSAFTAITDKTNLNVAVATFSLVLSKFKELYENIAEVEINQLTTKHAILGLRYELSKAGRDFPDLSENELLLLKKPKVSVNNDIMEISYYLPIVTAPFTQYFIFVVAEMGQRIPNLPSEILVDEAIEYSLTGIKRQEISTGFLIEDAIKRKTNDCIKAVIRQNMTKTCHMIEAQKESDDLIRVSDNLMIVTKSAIVSCDDNDTMTITEKSSVLIENKNCSVVAGNTLVPLELESPEIPKRKSVNIPITQNKDNTLFEFDTDDKSIILIIAIAVAICTMIVMIVIIIALVVKRKVKPLPQGPREIERRRSMWHLAFDDPTSSVGSGEDVDVRTTTTGFNVRK
ncbi:hypothetical protein PVAND_015046 [Polypedilum vanderplanki]|uniref:Integrase catalytic domain-containing protein n=1 Tax=Polypedilum vanderplanki TaxID=319348 RepID=A0A9J6BBG4_POLVA|nr:hypothetical protein PVAND_015046 [Polypedilum vanderplanki]